MTMGFNCRRHCQGLLTLQQCKMFRISRSAFLINIMAKELFRFLCLWPAVTWLERRVSKLFHVVSKQNRAIFLFLSFLFSSGNTNLPQPMPERTCTAGSTAYFCHRAALKLVWPRQQQDPGLDQAHAAMHTDMEKAVEKGLWRVNLDAPLSPDVRGFGKRCTVTRRNKLSTPQLLMLAEAAFPAQLPNSLAQAKMRPLQFCCPETFLSLTWLQLVLFSPTPRLVMKAVLYSVRFQCHSTTSSDWFASACALRHGCGLWDPLFPYCLISTFCVPPPKPW